MPAVADAPAGLPKCDDSVRKSSASIGRRTFSLISFPQTWLRVGLLVALLASHCGVRLYHTMHVPMNLGTRHDYNRTYGHSLSLILGRGFKDVPTVGTPAARPIDEFLWLGRTSLTEAELDAYAAHTPLPGQDPYYDIYHPLATTRVLDVHLTALVWRIFGVSWGAYYAVAAVASTACCALVFLIGMRLGGGFWPGFLAAAVFFASPTEKFFTGWSVRDASPLWFAAGAFCVLVMFFDRPSTRRRYALGAALLGMVAMLGTGWRMDALILAPFMAVGMSIAVAANTRRVVAVATALACFAAASLSTHLFIRSLVPDQIQAVGSGFHMAYYGDSIRSNVLGIENSSQVAWCDMQTLMEARRFDAAGGATEPLLYLSKPYGATCRRMYLKLLRNNIYNWTTAFPAIWWQAVRGFPDDSANDTGWLAYRNRILEQGHVEGQSLDFGTFDAAYPFIVPALTVIGALASVLYGPQRLLAAGLFLFAFYFAAISFAVLPMQKHMAMMLVPTCCFIGIGVWGLCRSVRLRTWIDVYRRTSIRGVLVSAGVIAATLATWGIACLISRQVSLAERRNDIEAIRALAASGEDAPEAILTPTLFRTSILPGSENDNVGYLLEVEAGAEPGPLSCRQTRVSTLDCRPTIVETSHQLEPGKSQHFFVSCFQGSEFGDPRSYRCVVRLSGAKFVSSRRVDMSSWNRPPVSTVFSDEHISLGSPSVAGRSTSWSRSNLAVLPDPEPGMALAVQSEGMLLAEQPARWPAPAGLLQHVAARDPETGHWQLLSSDGQRFEPMFAGAWSSQAAWQNVVSGDFDGDGADDIAGRALPGGSWWMMSNGQSTPVGWWNPEVEWKHICPGDFNGDGIDDVAGHAEASGQWWLALSDGGAFKSRRFGAWDAKRPFQFVVASDLNRDGCCDLLAYEPNRKSWVAFHSTGGSFEPPKETSAPEMSLGEVTAGDFNGDGNPDIAAIAADRRSGYLALSKDADLEFVRFDLTAFATACVCAGDFDGNGSDELVMSDEEGRLRRARWSAGAVSITPCGRLDKPVERLLAGDFTGSGRPAIAALRTGGEVHVGSFANDNFAMSRWCENSFASPGNTPLVLSSFHVRQVPRNHADHSAGGTAAIPSGGNAVASARGDIRGSEHRRR